MSCRVWFRGRIISAQEIERASDRNRDFGFDSRGSVLAGRLASRMAVSGVSSGVVSEAVEAYIPERCRPLLERSGAVRVEAIGGPLAVQVARLFGERAELVCIASAGVVVRLIAPVLVDKTRDPAVLVIDEAGRFVIPVLSGHVGGANASATRIADLIGAMAVLPTSSDVQGTIAVDLPGHDLGWQVEAERDTLLHAGAAVVNGERVGRYRGSVRARVVANGSTAHCEIFTQSHLGTGRARRAPIYGRPVRPSIRSFARG
jgi:cobalamin biosynthesis protein CbiG